MKTLQIVGDSKYGGAGYLLSQWCSFLASREWNVDVLATDPQVTIELGKIKNVRVINHIYIPREIDPLKDFSAFFNLLNWLHKEKYKVVHTYTATPGFIGRLSAYLARVPVVVHHQAGWTVTDCSNRMARLLYTPLEYIATLASTRGICVSNATRRQASLLHIAPQCKLVTICNGIDPELFIIADKNRETCRNALGLPTNCLAIGSTGRLCAQKDIATLIYGVAHLRKIQPDLKFLLLLAGHGPDLSKLRALTDELHMAEYIKFLGFLREIPNFLAALDIFISSSLKEGMSISILEAMAARKPIITTAIPPNAELIEDMVTGLLIPVKSPESVARSILKFVYKPDLAQKCAIEARAQVLKKYTINRMFHETWELYNNLLNCKNAPISSSDLA